MSELLKRLEMERMQGNFALNNYPNDEYWVNWDELVNVFEEYAQPKLNENQQQVLGWLKDYYKENRPFTTAFGAIRNIASKRWSFIKQNLTEDQQEHVLEVFSRWAQEQEEE